MIFRKPYAFLIKNFQKIHIGLLLLCIFVFYKTTVVRTFVKDFIATNSYNDFLEPIGNYIGPGLFLVLIIIMAIIITLMVLLRHKKKPWKIYLPVLAEYLFLFGLFVYVRNYFNTYDEYSTITAIMAARDLLLIAYLLQFLVFILLGIRSLGLDLKKFGFKNDKEYLEINEEDREEFEVHVEIDKDVFVRTWKRFWRNVKYVYREHRLVFGIITMIIIGGIGGYTYYYFGVLHKTYSEGSSFVANNYTIKVTNSYITERTTNGNYIVEDSKKAFVIVNLQVTNNTDWSRTINIDRFRLMNLNQEYKYTLQYNRYFSDLGTSFNSDEEMDPGETINFMLVFRVNKDDDVSKYVLYYQDVTDRILIKKTKLNIEDLREIETDKTIPLKESIEFPTGEDIRIMEATVKDQTTYNAYRCTTTSSCGVISQTLTNPNGKILEIYFTSNSFDGNSFVDFSNKYAKINYSNNSGEVESINCTSLVKTNYTGNRLYLNLPNDIDINGTLQLVYTFRNKQYVFELK